MQEENKSAVISLTECQSGTFNYSVAVIKQSHLVSES